jgi:hypothetical protein
MVIKDKLRLNEKDFKRVLDFSKNQVKQRDDKFQSILKNINTINNNISDA